jgi:hypothetical protein
MTATRDPDRLLRAWLDLMPSEAPDRAIAAVLQATQATPQVRVLPWSGSRRTARMSRLLLIAATALVAVALTGGAIFFAGGPGPTPTPAVAPPSPAPTARAASGPVPETTRGDWLADVPAIAEIGVPAGMIRLSIDWSVGDRIWLQTAPDDRQLLSSTTLVAPPGEIRVRSDATDSVHCATGLEGRYGWERSADGMFLTLTLLEDACAARAVVFARRWVHSHGAVNDGGRGINDAVSPMVEMVLPDRRWGMGTNTITTFEGDPAFDLVWVQAPLGFADPCASAIETIEIDQSIDGFAAYLRGLPGFTVTSTTRRVGGRPAARLVVVSDGAVACARSDVPEVRPLDSSNGAQDLYIELGATQSLWVVDVGDYLIVFSYAGTGIDLADEEALFSTIKFVTALPTT